jgi:hypothetical protein
MAAKSNTKTKSNKIKVACTTNVGIMIAAGDTAVTPPVAQGTEYGTVNCGKLLGAGVQTDTFTVDPNSGDTVAHYTVYFSTGSVHGSYDLTPQESAFNFLETDDAGTIIVKGATGALKGVKGTGTITCQSLDGIHTTCKLKLKVSAPTTTG